MDSPALARVAALLALISLGGCMTADHPRSPYWAFPVPAQGDPPKMHVSPADRMDAAACGLCHLDIYKQWRDSLHAAAFSSGLAGQLVMRTDTGATSCLQCHAPREEQWRAWAADDNVGADYRHGVDCAGCHLRGHRRHGPRSLQTLPHGEVIGREEFGLSGYCSPCHQFPETDPQANGKPLANTFEEWSASEYATTGTSCQSCHMPDGRHEFKGIHDREMTRRALAVEVRRTDQGVSVELHNRGAGHHLPTYGTPRITVRIESTLAEPTSTQVYSIRRSLDWDPENGWIENSDTRLAAGVRKQLMMQLEPTQGASVEVLVEPDFDYTDRVYPRLLQLPESVLTAAARDKITTALQQGQARRYVLTAHTCPSAVAGSRHCSQSEDDQIE